MIERRASSTVTAENIINTIREPLITLDQDLRVLSVSRSFYQVFQVQPEETVGQLIYDLGNKQWDIPQLKELLERILPRNSSFDNYEVVHNFAGIGQRTMLLNARQIETASGSKRIILLAIDDITDRRAVERGLEKTRKELEEIKKVADEASELAQSIINTVREPLISLDQNLRVVSVSRSFYELFQVKPEETVGQLIYDLGNKQWNIPKLRELLETILPEQASFDNYQVEHEFANIGRRVMLLNARQIRRASGKEQIILLAFEDITGRHETELALKVRYEQQEMIFDSYPAMIFYKDRENRFIRVNEPLAQANGLSKQQMEGKTCWDMYSKEAADRYWRDDLEVMSTGLSKTNIIEPMVTPSGIRIIQSDKVPYQDIDGNTMGVLGFTKDITDSMKLEEDHRKLAAIVESADDAIIGEDFDGTIMSWNQGAATAYGYESAEILGKSIRLLVPPHGLLDYEAKLKKVALGETITHFETQRVKKDGSIVDAALSMSPVRNSTGAIVSISTIARDITERLATEGRMEETRKELEALKMDADESREYSESLVNTVREPLIALNQDLRVVTVSRSFYEVFKVNPDETVGHLIYDLGNKQWDIPKLRELLETILPQKATFDNYEVEHDFTGIGRRIMLLNARQIQRASGKEQIILLAIEDITERREFENGLKAAHQDLKELATKLEHTAKVKSEFLANMSHELRTPLNSINGFSEVLYDQTFGPLNEKQLKYCTNVLTSGRHLLALINQILDMAKVEAGKMTLDVTTVPLKVLLEEISMLVQDMALKKNITLVLEISEDLPDIEADELKIKEVIYNLLSNAVKFTPENQKIGMRAKKSKKGVEVEVWDKGIGIAPENMEKIFEGFFRVDTPYSRITEGTGLGLPISKKMVELHNGKLSVESHGLKQGTSVRFWLPILGAVGGVV